ncbi:hypothetical protein GCM10010306_088520 [Streptomyces umbrinus]|nr:hypothetical protein GCM10010306_088520 [Streptomyces umbrinus]
MRCARSAVTNGFPRRVVRRPWALRGSGVVKDSVGNVLQDGGSVVIVKALKV